MGKMFKILFLSAFLLVGTYADNLLFNATNGSVSDITFKKLDKTEMKQIVGGYYKDIRGLDNATSGVFQTIGVIIDRHPENGRKLVLIAEKYGKDLSRGYDIYLAYDNRKRDDDMPKYKDTMRGRVYDFERVRVDSRAISRLSYKYIDDAKRSLLRGTPIYAR